MKAHATLSASGAERWIACPGSIRLSAGLTSYSSAYALEGTAAHAVASHCLEKGFDAERFAGWGVDVKDGSRTRFVEQFSAGVQIDDEMVDGVQVYLDYARSIIEPGDEWEIEQRLDLSAVYSGMFGTADLLVYKPKTKALIVVDFKYGRGVAVEADENPQLRYYAVGAALRYHNRGIAHIDMVIVQPRAQHPAGPIRTSTIDATDMLEWTADLVAAAKLTEEPSAPLNPGDWCRFCPAAGICPALRDKALASAKADFTEGGKLLLTDPTGYKPDLLSKTLHEVDLIEDWCRRVRDFAHHEAEAGRVPPGWKLVPTRATRKWKDESAVPDYLVEKVGMKEDDCFKPAKLESPAGIERALKAHYGYSKAQAEQLIANADLVEKVSSGTVLAPLDDPREPVKPSAQTDFGGR